MHEYASSSAAHSRYPFSSQSLLLAVVGLILSLLLHGCNEVPDEDKPLGSGGTTALANITEKIMLKNKAKSDQNEYGYARLSNGLQIVNVHDKKAKQVGVAVSVQVGQLHEPKKVLGLAHFCEHMLFLGTKKYPNPDDFSEFTNRYGGGSNAFTASEATVYYTILLQAGWKESLSRISDFFRAPLFEQQYVEKEVHAIESEHAKNVQSQGIRTESTMNSLADPRSPIQWFHTGNVDTLVNDPKKEGMDPVEELKKFYQAHYCPSHLTVVTYGSGAVDSQLQDVRKEFGSIPKGKCSPATLTSQTEVDPWFPKDEGKDGHKRTGNWVHMQASQEKSQLVVMWPVDSLQSLYKNLPEAYLSHVLSWPGEHSLIRALKDESGLVYNLEVSIDTTSLVTQIYITFTLTHRGREKPIAVLELLYAFLAQVRHEGVDMSLFRSIKDASQFSFDWSGNNTLRDVVVGIAHDMTWVPKEDVLFAGSIIPNPDAEITVELLQKLTPEHMNVGFVDTKFKPHDASKLQKLQYWGVPHTIRPMTDVVKDRESQWSSWLREAADLSSIAKDIETQFQQQDIPVPQPMRIAKAIQDIPSNVTLANAKAKLGDDDTHMETKAFGVRPEEIPQDCGGSLWFREGTIVESPKVYAGFLLRTGREPGDGLSAKDDLLLTVFVALKTLLLEPLTANLAATGEKYDIGIGKHMGMALKGYTEALPKLEDQVFKEIGKELDLSNEAGKRRYDLIIEELTDQFQVYSQMPVMYAVADRNGILQKGYRSRREYVESLKELKAEDVPGALKKLVLSKKLHYSSFVIGNIPRTDAEKLHKSFAEIYKGLDLTIPFDQIELEPPVVKPQRPIEIRKRNPKPGDKNHVTIVSLILGVPTVEDRVFHAILGDLLSHVSYFELRTQRSLGYVANAGKISVSNIHGFSVVVQGMMKTPDEVEPLIEWVFNVKMREELKSMKDDAFERFKNSFIESMHAPPETFGEEHAYWEKKIAQGGQCFGLVDQMMEFAKTKLTSKQQLIDAWERAMSPSETGMRRKISVKYFGSDSVPPRPDSNAFIKALEAEKVTSTSIELAKKEHAATLEFDEADTNSREKVRKDAETKAGKGQDYFPEDLGCTPKNGVTSTAALMQSNILSSYIRGTSSASPELANEAGRQATKENAPFSTWRVKHGRTRNAASLQANGRIGNAASRLPSWRALE